MTGAGAPFVSVPGAPFGARQGRDQAEECTGGAETTTAHLRLAALLSTDVSTTPPSPTGPRPAAATIRLATFEDAAAILSIYNVEVANHTSTFDLVPRTLDDQRRWISERSGAFSAVVAAIHDEVVGFASLSPYKERAAYRTTVENSVYVSRDHPRLGIGRSLMEHVIGIAADSGFHSIMARIEASSTASRALHAACGFQLVGVEREVGRKFNRWLDVAVMQLML